MSGTARRLAEAANQIVNPQPIAEAFKNGDKVKVPHKGKMVSGRIIRYDDGGTSKAQQHGGGYVVDVGEPASIFVTKEKIQKEEAEQIDEVVRSLHTDELLNAIEKAYKKGGLRGVIKGDKQVSDTTVDEVLRDMKPLFGNDMEYAVKKIKRLLKPQDYAKYKTKMEGWGEEVEQIDEVRRATKDADVAKRVFMPASPSAERRHKEEDSKKPGEIWTTKPDSFGQTRVGAKNLDGFVRYFRSGMEPTAKKWAKKREIGKRVPFFKDDPYREEYREEVVTEISKATKDAYVAKRGSQLQRMTTGLDKDRNLLTGRQQANAVKGIKRATGVKAEEVVAEAEWKSLKKTKVDLNALRKQGYKISVQHGEGDTLYKITGKPSKPATAKKEEVEESVQQIDLENLLVELVNEETLDESLKKKIMAALLALGVAAGPAAAAAADVATVNSNQNKTTITQPTKRNLNWRKAAAIAGAGLSTAGLVMSLKRKD